MYQPLDLVQVQAVLMNFHKKTKSTKRVSSMCLSAHFGKGVSRFRGQQPTASHIRDYPAQQGYSVLNRRVTDDTRDSRTAKVSRTNGLKTKHDVHY